MSLSLSQETEKNPSTFFEDRRLGPRDAGDLQQIRSFKIAEEMRWDSLFLNLNPQFISQGCRNKCHDSFVRWVTYFVLKSRFIIASSQRSEYFRGKSLRALSCQNEETGQFWLSVGGTGLLGSGSE